LSDHDFVLGCALMSLGSDVFSRHEAILKQLKSAGDLDIFGDKVTK
jgi:hypothetical protein